MSLWRRRRTGAAPRYQLCTMEQASAYDLAVRPRTVCVTSAASCHALSWHLQARLSQRCGCCATPPTPAPTPSPSPFPTAQPTTALPVPAPTALPVQGPRRRGTPAPTPPASHRCADAAAAYPPRVRSPPPSPQRRLHSCRSKTCTRDSGRRRKQPDRWIARGTRAAVTISSTTPNRACRLVGELPARPALPRTRGVCAPPRVRELTAATLSTSVHRRAVRATAPLSNLNNAGANL